MTEEERLQKIAFAEDWLDKQRKSLAMAVYHCKEIVDAIEKTEREIAVLHTSKSR